ncbi:MAG: hypothetical protein IT444_11335 [Phycisphaeraceae bacterium]|nr:hypothetical protein [Phycisphaeraceae bacterium]
MYFFFSMHDDEPIFGMQISHVRAILGFACREVMRTGRPLGIRRYRDMDVVLVPLAEWERLKAVARQMVVTNEKDPGVGPGSEAGRADVTR